MENINYRILTATEAGLLEIQVSDYLYHNWELHGNLIVIYTGFSFIYIQAIIRGCHGTD